VPHSPFVEQYSSGIGKFTAFVHAIAVHRIFSCIFGGRVRGEFVSNCNRISALALLQSVQELVKLMAELDDLRSRVRQAEAATVLARPPRNGLPSGEPRWH
jgi:hypothetical protein